MFPLFQQLYSKYASTPPTSPPSSHEVQNFVSLLKKSPDDPQFLDFVYLLIRCYQLEIDERNILENPYDMKKMKTGGVKFNFSALPVVLQHILIDFMGIHLHKKETFRVVGHDI